MENVIPYMVVCLAMCIHKDRTNLAACGVFAFFYSIALVIKFSFGGTADYFIWSIATAPIFLIVMSMLSKITKLVILLCLTEIVLLIIDIVSLVAYNMEIEWLYQLRWWPETIAIAVQTASLLVRHGTDNDRIHNAISNLLSRPVELVRAKIYN